jgi:hypothetical protein
LAGDDVVGQGSERRRIESRRFDNDLFSTTRLRIETADVSTVERGHRASTDRPARIDIWNDRPRPYLWTKTANQVLHSIARYCTQITTHGARRCRLSTFGAGISPDGHERATSLAFDHDQVGDHP